ncbi:MAG: redoxin domain-containing protein [Gemmatimonadota bacterium]
MRTRLPTPGPAGRAGRLLRRAGVALLALVGLATAAWAGYRLGLDPAARSNVRAWLGGDGTAAPEGEWLEIRAPDVAFRDLDGAEVRLADYRGQVVLLNFWGSWCFPCLREIPELTRIQPVLEDLGGTIVAPAISSGSEETVRRFMRDHGINYPVWMGENDVAIGDFGVRGYPFSLLIDRDGMIRKEYLGPQTAKVLLRDIGRLVVERPAG